jgi:hypothetical protein
MTAAIDIVKASFDRWDAIDQVYSSFRESWAGRLSMTTPEVSVGARNCSA